jgi:hypothetical protein
VCAVKYELGFYIPEDDFFIVTAVKTSNLTKPTSYYTFYVATLSAFIATPKTFKTLATLRENI